MTIAARPHEVEPAVAPPPGNPRFALVDTLRAIAALGVVAFHASAAAGAFGHSVISPVTARLEIGVAIFFAISGFLLYRPFFAAQYEGRAATPVPRYLLRRLLRIVPAYWLALTVLAVWPGLPGVFTKDWWIYYGFGQIYDRSTFALGISQAWSLGVEVAFYLALPLLALGLARPARGRDRRALVRSAVTGIAVVAVASCVLRQWGYANGNFVLGFSLLGHLHWFAPGMLLAVVTVVRPQSGWMSKLCVAVGRHPWLPWAIAIVPFAILCAVMDQPQLTVPYPPWQEFGQSVLSPAIAGLLLAPAVIGASAGGWVRKLLAWRVLGWLGLVSYGIYLWHQALAVKLERLGVVDAVPSFLQPLVLFASAGAAAVVLAALSYYGLERPLLRLKNRGARRSD